MIPGWLLAPFGLFDTNTTAMCETCLVDRYNPPLSGFLAKDLSTTTLCLCSTTSMVLPVLILTSCRLISLVENVPFWWMSSVSDHSVLFLLLGGVGAAALLQGFWGTPGDLPSPRNEACRSEGGSPRCQTCCNWKPSCVVQQSEQQRWSLLRVPFLWDATGAYLDGLAEAPDGPILHRRDEVG